MSARKAERLLNLVICLLATRRFLTVDQIREAVPDYAAADSGPAFRRMFERDKEDLRELGIPLETGTMSAFDDEVGYRVPRERYALPEISLAADEAAVVRLATQLWRMPALAAPARAALLKLRAAGVETEEDALPPGLEPRVDGSAPAFAALWEGVRDARPVSFDYRRAGAASPMPRTVEPWGIVSWHGRWYVVGRDLDRDAARVFRIDRIAGEVRAAGPAGTVAVPHGVDLRAQVAAFAAEEPTGTALVRVRAGRAHELRREAVSVRPDRGGWDLLEVGFADPERFADRVVWYGADVVVLEPPPARAAVVDRLRAALAASGAGRGLPS
ncbi:MAG: helix-turn-helix transcriptional regulator [Mycobacterium leprae]